MQLALQDIGQLTDLHHVGGGTAVRPLQTVHVSMGRMPSDHNPSGGISARLVSFSADSADPPGLNDYDSFAEGYAASNETSFVHAYYERPAMLALAGDVAGLRFSTPAAALVR